jgi:uncharacterized Fe-S center protein
MASTVHFTSMVTGMRESLIDKFDRLIKAAGIDSLDFQNKYVAIKLHFGELGNMAFLRHNYARHLVAYVKERGGRPFVTDCNTLYVGMRTNALDHLDCAYANGYNPLSLGCQVLIADGLKGLDETLVSIDGEYVKQAKIGSAVMDADIVISLNHFKSHEQAGIGGAIKNVGMGCGSRAGKMEMHYSGKPSVDAALCVNCGRCVAACGQSAIHTVAGRAVIDQEACVGCGRCIGQCSLNAISPNTDNSVELLSRRMAEYAWAVLKDRPHFHVSLAIDISPFCDCYDCNDVGIVPDIGMFASLDPVALDKACADAVNAKPAKEHSYLAPVIDRHADHFHAIHPDNDWEGCLAHCEKLGLGTQDYTLVTI